MASLQHLGGDRWRVRLYVPGDGTTQGRQVSRSFRANGERAAKRKVSSIEVELQAEQDERVDHRGTVAELVEDWLTVSERVRSESTMVAYSRHARRIIARFGRMQAADLTGRDIDRWYGELQRDGATDATVAVVHRHLRAVLRFGYRKRGLPTIATDQASPAAHRSPDVDPPPPEQLARLIVELPGELHVQWARAVALIVATGMRRGEVVGLRWDDWEGDRFRVRHSVVEVSGGIVVRDVPKGKRNRYVPVVPGARRALERQREWAESAGVESPWVFPDMTKGGRQPRRPGWVSLMWGRNRDRLGASGVGLHALRHAFATVLLDGGVPVNVVQDWLGHAQASTTINIYGHRGRVGELAGRQALERALSPESPAPLPPPPDSS